MSCPSRLAATLALAAIALVAAPRARADFPSLSRPWALGTPAGAGAPGMRLGADVSVAMMARSESSGTADPRLRSLEPGGRLRASLVRDRFDIGADVILDTRWNVDSREYPQRLSLACTSRAGSARLGAGFESSLYDGSDLELESAPLPLARPRGAFAPVVVGWARVRKLDFRDDWLLTPALGLASGALARDAAGFGMLLSAQMDLSRADRPSGFGMVAARWTGGTVDRGGDAGSPLGTPGWGAPATRWFVHAAYAFPLERAQYARVTLAAGVGFDGPF